MPGPTLPNTGIILPALGGDAGTWDIELNACFSNYDVHDHSAGKGVKITPSGISINAALSFAGNPASNVGQVAFSEVAALAAGADIIFVNSADHELYWRTAGGVNVKLTAGNSINTSLVGGILGDYSTVGAQLSYDDANTQYLAKTKTPFNWAYVHSGGVRLAPAGGASALYTGVLCNAAIAGSFNITLPSALPAATSIAYVSATGQVGYTPPDRVTIIPPSAADLASNARGQVNTTLGENQITLSVALNYVSFPVLLPVGAVIKSAVVYVNKTTSNTTTLVGSCVVTDMTTGAVTQFSTGNSTNAPGYTTIAGSNIGAINTTITSVMAIYVAVGVSAGAGTTDNVLGVAITWTPPI